MWNQTAIECEFTTVGAACDYTVETVTEILQKMIEGGQKGYTFDSEVRLAVHEGKTTSIPNRARAKEKIVVVGTINIDRNMLVKTLPEVGRTHRVYNMMEFSGGKGGNQATGIGKAGGNAALIGCLGDDHDGYSIYEKLRRAGVNLDGVSICNGMTTGSAYITVNETGESAILVHTGANDNLNTAYIDARSYLFDDAKFCLLNTEISMEAVRHVLEICREKGVKTVLKPSAVRELDPSVYPMVDYLIPNEKEAETLANGAKTLEERAQYFFDAGVGNVIITLSENGCYLKNGEFEEYFKGYEMPVVDTTGGADAFISTLVMSIVREYDLRTAIELANYAGAVCVSRYGVQDALIDREALSAYMNSKMEK